MDTKNHENLSMEGLLLNKFLNKSYRSSHLEVSVKMAVLKILKNSQSMSNVKIKGWGVGEKSMS